MLVSNTHRYLCHHIHNHNFLIFLKAPKHYFIYLSTLHLVALPSLGFDSVGQRSRFGCLQAGWEIIIVVMMACKLKGGLSVLSSYDCCRCHLNKTCHLVHKVSQMTASRPKMMWSRKYADLFISNPPGNKGASHGQGKGEEEGEGFPRPPKISVSTSSFARRSSSLNAKDVCYQGSANLDKKCWDKFFTQPTSLCQ